MIHTFGPALFPTKELQKRESWQVCQIKTGEIGPHCPPQLEMTQTVFIFS